MIYWRALIPLFMEVSKEQIKEWYDKWKNIWEMQLDSTIEISALIRAIECTNGCVQWAYRDGEEDALDLEKTRECMKVSMSFIKNKVLKFPTGRHSIHCPPTMHKIMDNVRDLYIKGNKQNDEIAYAEFLTQSKAHFHVLGKERIDDAFDFFKLHFEDIFTDYWIAKGRDYCYYMGDFDDK